MTMDLPGKTVVEPPSKDHLTTVPTELFHDTLLLLSMKDLLLSQRVSRYWKKTIDGSTRLQKKLFFKQTDHPGELYRLGDPEHEEYYKLEQHATFNPLLFRALGPLAGSLVDFDRLTAESSCHYMQIISQPRDKVSCTFLFSTPELIPETSKHRGGYTKWVVRGRCIEQRTLGDMLACLQELSRTEKKCVGRAYRRRLLGRGEFKPESTIGQNLALALWEETEDDWLTDNDEDDEDNGDEGV